MGIQAKRILLAVLAVVFTLPELAQAQRQVEQELETAANPEVSIEMGDGDLMVLTWGRNAVRVEGTLDAGIEEFDVRGDEDEVRIEVTPDWERGHAFGRSETRLTVTVPRESSLEIESMNGAIEVSEVAGDVEVEAVNGPIQLRGINGRVDVESVNGPVTAERISGPVSIESVNGPVTLEHLEGDSLELSAVNGPLKVDSVARSVEIEAIAGRVELQLQEVDELEIAAVSADVDSRLKLNDSGEIEISSVSSAVSLTLVEPDNVSVSVESMSGPIINGINDVEPVEQSFGIGRSLNFEEGRGSAEISIETLSGRIELQRD